MDWGFGGGYGEVSICSYKYLSNIVFVASHCQGAILTKLRESYTKGS